MNRVLRIYETCNRLPLGNHLFSRMVGLRAPYFKTVGAVFTRLEKGYGEIFMKNRKKVRNHINSVHAIAMCNMCELVGGMTVECTIPSGLQWIPREMTVEYLKVARTDLTATCRIAGVDWQAPMDLPITVMVQDAHGDPVLRAKITMYVRQK